MRIAGRHWVVAFAAAMLVHGAVTAAMLWEPAASGARSAGLGGIEVSLGPAGGAPGSIASAAADMPEAEPVAPAEAQTEPVLPAATAKPPDLAGSETAEFQEAAVAVPIDTVRAEAVEEVTAAVAAKASPMDDAAVVERRPPVDTIDPVRPPAAAEVKPRQEVVARAPVAPPPARPRPRPRALPPVAATPPLPAPEPAKAQPAPPGESPDHELATAAPSVAGVGGKAGTGTHADAGMADANSGGGIPGAATDYMALLQAWLEKHKEYPRRARLRRQEGTAVLYFVMDRDGHVLEYRIRRSSGYPALDKEVEEMIERAQPLPPMPDKMHRARLELVVPVRFLLR